MSLADELLNEKPRTHTCGTCKWYDSLDAADKADFDAWLGAGKEVAALHRACKRLKGNPYPLARCSMAKHVLECRDAS